MAIWLQMLWGPDGFSNIVGKPALTPQQLIDKMEADVAIGRSQIFGSTRARRHVDQIHFVRKFAPLVHNKNADAVVYGYTALLDPSSTPGNKRAKFDTEGGAEGKASQ